MDVDEIMCSYDFAWHPDVKDGKIHALHYVWNDLLLCVCVCLCLREGERVCVCVCGSDCVYVCAFVKSVCALCLCNVLSCKTEYLLWVSTCMILDPRLHALVQPTSSSTLQLNTLQINMCISLEINMMCIIGKKTVKEAAKEFMLHWGAGAADGVVTYEEFEDHYKGI